MASGREIRAGKGFVELGIKDRVSQALRGLKRRFQDFNRDITRAFKQLAIVAGAAAGAIGLVLRQFMKMGDEIHKASLRTGMSAEAFSELKHAAEEADVSLEQLVTGLAQLARRNPGKTIEQVADEIAAMTDHTEQVNHAMENFGRAGAELLPLLKGGSAAIRAARKEAQELGIVMSDETAAGAAELNDSWGAMWKQFKFFVANVGSIINGIFGVTDSLKWLSEQLGVILNFLRKNEIGKAWSFLWRAIARFTLSIVLMIIRPISGMIDWIIDRFKWLLAQVTKMNKAIVGLFTDDYAMAFDAVLKELDAPSDIVSDFENMIDDLTKSMKELEIQSRKAIGGPEAAGGAGTAADRAKAMSAASFGTFDPSLVLRSAIGRRATDERIAVATERTAEATERMNWSMERFFKTGTKLSYK